MTTSFRSTVETLLGRYEESALIDRWDEAISFGARSEANAFWIRESEDVVNIVWLNRDGIRDITFLPPNKESMFNFVPLANITTFEIREEENVAGKFPLGVSGNLLVQLILPSSRGELYWVAHNTDEITGLRAFFKVVLEAFSSIRPT